jgi:hypothetical protein
MVLCFFIVKQTKGIHFFFSNVNHEANLNKRRLGEATLASHFIKRELLREGTLASNFIPASFIQSSLHHEHSNKGNGSPRGGGRVLCPQCPAASGWCHV